MKAVWTGLVCGAVVSATVRGQSPVVTAEIFAPGVVSGVANAGSPTFTPDGNTMYFTRTGASWSVILESHRSGGHWSTPRIAPFSGEWSDSQPAMSPDGAFLVFVSWRPTQVANLWRVRRQGSGWSAAERLPDAVNISTRIFKPSVAADGSIYFFTIGTTDKGKTCRLYRSQNEHGVYQPATPLPFSDGSTGDVDPEIAPDESFLVFSSSGRRSADDTHEHLFIARKPGTAWGPVTPMRYAGDDARPVSDDNEAHLSPDHRTLYFSSNRTLPVHFPRSRDQAARDIERLMRWDTGNTNAWSVPLASWLDTEKS